MGLRSGMFVAVLAAGAALPAIAQAQGVVPPPGPTTPPTPEAAPTQALQESPPAPADAAVDGSEIVVTAQRRSERLRDVPISITALGQTQLVQAGINSLTDIQRLTPGVQLPFYGGYLQPAIRGISSAGAGLGDSSNVAIYVDGIYQASQSGQLVDLPDTQQIEVLKGPQGTLYGQNAAGGAIIVSTITPSFETSGRASASYGNYDDVSLRGYATTPLVADKVALSIAGAYRDRGGYRRDILRGGHDSGLKSSLVRARLLVQPTDTLSFTLGGYYSDRKDGGVYAGNPYPIGTPLGYALGAAYGIPVPRPADPQEIALNVQPLVRLKTYGVNLLGKLDTGIGTFSTVTAFTDVRTHNTADVDYTAVNLGLVDIRLKNRNFIQEVNFVSAGMGGLTLSAGAFFMALKEIYDNNRFTGYFLAAGDPLTVYPETGTPRFVVDQHAFNRKRSYAAYAEAAYAITDALTVTAGGRYSYETQQTADNHSAIVGGDGPLIPDPRGKVSFKRFTPKATIRYALNPTSNVYASYSQGFKSGFVNSGDNPFVTPLVKPVQPEKVFAYEVGYKGRPADWLTLNAAAFWYDYKDLQVYIYNPPNELYQNAASARIKGVDADVTVRLAPQLTFSAGGAYLDAKYRRFPGASAFAPNAFGFGFDIVAVDASGNRLTRAPKWSGNASLNYQIETGAGKFGAYVNGTYNSGVYYDAANTIRQRRYALLDAELSFSPAGVRGLRLVAWGKNLTDRDYITSALSLGYVLGVSYADPRTYGVRAEFAF